MESKSLRSGLMNIAHAVQCHVRWRTDSTSLRRTTEHHPRRLGRASNKCTLHAHITILDYNYLRSGQLYRQKVNPPCTSLVLRYLPTTLSVAASGRLVQRRCEYRNETACSPAAVRCWSVVTSCFSSPLTSLSRSRRPDAGGCLDIVSSKSIMRAMLSGPSPLSGGALFARIRC